MSPPSTSVPARPPTVPEHAVWEAEHQFWRVGDSDPQGRWEGCQFTYRGDGSLQGEFTYVAGKPDGKFRRFHPTGELALEGEHRLGTPVGTRYTFRSSGTSDEAVHTCCLPSRAWKVVTQYLDDGRFLEDYFDAEGLRMLKDGSAYPDLPGSVSPEAWFELDREGWVAGSYERAKPHGCLTFWSKSGVLREVAHYEHGQLEGSRERYDAERCVERRTYKAGQCDGPAWEHVAAGRFERHDIFAQEGFYERGEKVGKWRYLDREGQVLAIAELGSTIDSVPLDDDVFRTITTDVTFALDPAREHVRRLLQLSHKGTVETLRASVSAVPQLSRRASEQWLKTLRNESLDPPRYIAKLLRALLLGARAEHVFRSLSTVYLREPLLALQLLQVSLFLDPNDTETRAAEIMYHTGLGHVGQARNKITQFTDSHPIEAADLLFNLEVTFPEFSYWATQAHATDDVSPELPTSVAQPIGSMRQALTKAATRLQRVRTALLQYRVLHGVQEFSMPPDLSSWTQREPTTLDAYTYECEGDEIQVEERLDLTGYSLTELMLQARHEWTMLCWLYFACGAPSDDLMVHQRLPETVSQPAHFDAVITRAFQELYRVTDQLQTSGIRSRRQGVPDCLWSGRSVTELGRVLLLQAFTEFRERRAALFFASDETCRSAWQDDLRTI